MGNGTSDDNVVLRTALYDVRVPRRPHIPKDEGGHIVIYPHTEVSEFFELPYGEAVAIACAVQQVTRGLFAFMREIGHPLYTVNVQDNGNWAFLRGEAKSFHLHVYGRAIDEVHQEYGRALSFHGQSSRLWDTFEPLSRDDVLKILEYGEQRANI